MIPDTNKIRILLINHEYPPAGGGAATVTRELAGRFSKSGYEILLLTGTIKDCPMAADETRFPVFNISSRRNSNWAGSYREFIRFFIRAIIILPQIQYRFQPTITLAFFSIPSGLVALIQKWLFGVPYIVSIRGGDIPGFRFDRKLSFFHWLLKFLIKLVLYQADRIHVNSTRLKDLTQRLMPNRAIVHIPNGVNIPVGNTRSILTSGKIKLLFVGRLSKQKNIPVLLKAISQLSFDQQQKLEFDIVGDGPEKAWLKGLVQELNLGDYVRFSGWIDRDNLQQVYEEHNVLVLPSIDEGMPNTALEAIAHGCLVISSAAGQIRFADIDIDNNRIVEDGTNPVAWKNKLLDALNNPNSVKQDAERIRQAVLAKLSWDVLIPDYIKLITLLKD